VKRAAKHTRRIGESVCVRTTAVSRFASDHRVQAPCCIVASGAVRTVRPRGARRAIQRGHIRKHR